MCNCPMDILSDIDGTVGQITGSNLGGKQKWREKAVKQYIFVEFNWKKIVVRFMKNYNQLLNKVQSENS